MPIHNFEQYVSLAVRTESIDRSGRWQAAIPRDIYRINHALTGLVTEIGEVQEALDAIGPTDPDGMLNLKEELGDLWWYAAILADEFGTVAGAMTSNSVSYLDVEQLQLEIQHLFVLIGDWFDVIKRRIYYNAGPDNVKASFDRIEPELLLKALTRLAFFSGLKLVDIWDANVAKLSARYPEKFTTEAALDRDTEAERKALGG